MYFGELAVYFRVMKKMEELRAIMRDIAREVKLLPEKEQDEAIDVMLSMLERFRSDVDRLRQEELAKFGRALGKAGFRKKGEQH